MQSVRTDAVVLKRSPFGESDWVISLFTRDNGLVTAMARGARRSRRRFGGVLDVLARLRIVLEIRKVNAMPFLAGASLVDFGLGLRQGLDRLAHAYYMSELLWRGVRPGVRMPDLYDAFVRALERMAADGPDPLTVAAFLLRYQEAQGYRPKLDRCAVCESGLNRSARIPISYKSGGAVCAACVGRTEVNLRLPMRVVDWLRGVLSSDGSLSIPAEADWPPARHFLHRFIQYHLDVVPTSWKWWQGILERETGAGSRESDL